MKILAIETSFDETAIAIVQDGTHVLFQLLTSSSSLHESFGGVLPELAARKQVEYIIPMLSETFKHHPLSSIDAIAVTIGPGLIGSLLVGVEAAKTIAFIANKPIIPVNHVHAHIYANFIKQERQSTPEIEFPALALVVSGGHTELFYMQTASSLAWLGGTIDDAAGEAFDKTARLLGFGNRGGKAIEEAARRYAPSKRLTRPSLPRPLVRDDTLSFSFSGLKTAVLREWEKEIYEVNAFAYEIQEAITDALVEKTLKATKNYPAKTILLSGGVAANERLREKFAERSPIPFVFPPKEFCTDNAVMIGAAASFIGTPTEWRYVEAMPDLPVETD